jgi:ribulose kinase
MYPRRIGKHLFREDQAAQIHELLQKLSEASSEDESFVVVREWLTMRLSNRMDMLRCAYCGERAWDEYMVHDSVWREANLHHACGSVHVRCLEKLLDRRLTRQDFDDAPINWWVIYLLDGS